MRHQFAIINEQGNTIWVRSSTSGPEAALDALETLQPQYRDQKLHLIESIEDAHSGRELRQRLAMPYARAKVANPQEQAVVVELWHRLRLFGPADGDYFGTEAPERVAREEYTQASEFLAPASNPLESVFAASQNLDASWRPRTPTRSTSVGDILVVKARPVVGGDEYWRVMSAGFAKVQHFD
jgi:hypothetical protein